MTHPPMLRYRTVVTSVPDSWYSYPFFISMSCWSLYPGAWETLVKSQEWNLEEFLFTTNGIYFLKQPLFYLHRISDPHHINADPDLDPSFHFNTDPDQTFSTSMQIRIRILLHIIIMRVCDYCFKDPPFYSSTPPSWASMALHGSIFNLLKLLKFEPGFSWPMWKFQLKKIKILYQ